MFAKVTSLPPESRPTQVRTPSSISSPFTQMNESSLCTQRTAARNIQNQECTLCFLSAMNSRICANGWRNRRRGHSLLLSSFQSWLLTSPFQRPKTSIHAACCQRTQGQTLALLLLSFVCAPQRPCGPQFRVTSSPLPRHSRPLNLGFRLTGCAPPLFFALRREASIGLVEPALG